MSQEKIDAYKKEKAGRKQRLAKQKIRRKITKVVCALIVVAVIAAIAGNAIWKKNGATPETVDAAIAASSEASADTAATASSEASATTAAEATSEASVSESVEATSEASAQ